MTPFFTVLGITGSVLCIALYFAIARGLMCADSRWYYILNGIGALLVFIGVLHHFDNGDLGALLQEGCWIAVSVFGLWNIRAKNKE